MSTKIVCQPKEGQLIDELTHQLARSDVKFTTFRVLVAYARRSGVERLANSFAAFRKRGGTVNVVCGIGQKNTSFEALEALLTLSDALFLFHNKSRSKTFHPKIYCLEASDSAWASVGSSNFTYGGLVSNYEANQLSEFDLKNPSSSKQWLSLVAAFGSYLPSASAASVQLDVATLQRLRDCGAVLTESALRAVRKSESTSKEARSALGDIFGEDTAHDPPASSTPVQPTAAHKKKAKSRSKATGGFWKKLSNWDVNLKSSPGQIQIPKDFKGQFPTLGLPELTPSGAEQTDVYFNVLFEDSAGSQTLVKNARLILYVPAPTHQRPNQELRFTFRDRSIAEQLRANDVLEFHRSETDDYWFKIVHVPAAKAKLRTGRWGRYSAP